LMFITICIQIIERYYYYYYYYYYKKKVKFTLVQALRLCTGRTTHRVSRTIILLYYDHGTRRG